VRKKKSTAGPAPAPQIQSSIKLSAEGAAAAVLGPLEAMILEALWTLGRPASAMELYEVVRRSHRAAPLTVITVANRLVAKRLLRREKRDDLFHYSPVYARETFTALVSRRVVEGILSVGGNAIAASFVDVLAERDPEQLAELARLVRRRLKEQEEGR
jgi:predicted transcriptional regulator